MNIFFWVKMANLQAERFNKKASDPKNKPDHIIKIVSLKQGQSIADIGAGGGYFSLRFAEIVGEKGRVYAVDTNEKFMEFIIKTARKKRLNNLYSILTTEDKLDITEKSLDVIVMRNVTHHLSNRTQYFIKLKRFLKPDGKIIIIDYKPSQSISFPGIFGHHVAKDTIIQEMKDAGYVLEQAFGFLTKQHFTLYSIL
jgi:ubiquinone/menaquinone biosynthesis C-methylase UbiE